MGLVINKLNIRAWHVVHLLFQQNGYHSIRAAAPSLRHHLQGEERKSLKVVHRIMMLFNFPFQNTEELIVDLKGLVAAARVYQRAMEGMKSVSTMPNHDLSSLTQKLLA